jgi:hypothetical protein
VSVDPGGEAGSRIRVFPSNDDDRPAPGRSHPSLTVHRRGKPRRRASRRAGWIPGGGNGPTIEGDPILRKVLAGVDGTPSARDAVVLAHTLAAETAAAEPFAVRRIVVGVDRSPESQAAPALAGALAVAAAAALRRPARPHRAAARRAGRAHARHRRRRLTLHRR